MTVVQASYSSPISYAPAFAKVRELLATGIEEGVFPGAVLMVGKRGEIIFQEAVGVLSKEDTEVNNPMRLETVFDIASLTQPIVTSTLMMLLLERGKLKLSDKVTRYVPGFGVHGKSEITIKHLLEHTSGLVHWHPFYEEIVSLSASSRMGILASSTAKDYVYQQISRLGLKHKPGTMQVFSDVGYIILGQIAERLIGAPLNKIAYKMIFQPLGMNSTTFIDLPMLKRGALEAQTDMVAPTEYCAWRKRTLIAEAHDDNAWAMGGISGHGGLFTTARDLHIFASNMLAASLGLDSIVSQKSIREFWYPWVEPFAPKAVADGHIRSNYSEAPHKWRFGWEGPNEDNRMLEGGMSPFAVGHSGFTGCSLWLEPELGLDIILMTNRIHPSRNNKKILDYRPKIHEAVIAAVI